MLWGGVSLFIPGAGLGVWWCVSHFGSMTVCQLRTEAESYPHF